MAGFFEDRLPKSWLDRFPEHVHGASEQLLEEGLQIHVGAEGLGLELDYEVEVTVFPCHVRSSGAEEAEASNAIPSDGRSVLLEATKDIGCAEGHCSISIIPARPPHPGPLPPGGGEGYASRLLQRADGRLQLLHRLGPGPLERAQHVADG